MTTKKMEPRNLRTPPQQYKDTKKYLNSKSLEEKELSKPTVQGCGISAIFKYFSESTGRYNKKIGCHEE